MTATALETSGAQTELSSELHPTPTSVSTGRHTHKITQHYLYRLMHQMVSECRYLMSNNKVYLLSIDLMSKTPLSMTT